MKILYLTTIPAPYRVMYFNKLSEYCKLIVVYERYAATDRNSKWKANATDKYKIVFLEGLKIGSDKSFTFKVIELINKNRNAKIIVHGYASPTQMIAITYMRLNKIPFYIEGDGALDSQESWFKHNIKKYLIGEASGWLVTGKITQKYFMKYGAEKDKIYTYPFASFHEKDILEKTISDEKKRQLKCKLGINEEYIVLAVGQFIYRKGFDVLIKACAKLDSNKKIGIYVIGGNEIEQYNSLLQKYNLNNIYFLDFLKADRLNKYYECADLFVLPTREDIWGLVVNEAMAKGLPVITTKKCVAGLELIENGRNGYIVPEENAARLAERIDEILSNKKLRLKMGECNLNKIRKYTIENMAACHIEILRNSI